MSKHYANLSDDSDTCPFCDSFDFSQIDKDKYFCRDCGENWKEDIPGLTNDD